MCTIIMLHAKNGQLAIDDTTMDYICFGTGEKVLVMIPGLGDGLTSVKGKAIPFVLLYRQYAKEYTIYVFSRKNKLQEGDSTRTMAADLAKACTSHDCHEKLSEIQSPTLIIGGKQDKIVTGEASVDMAKAITGSELFMYEQYGHGLYEEAKDFNERVITFLRNDNYPE